ncbi:MAG: SAVED domain-containing protein [Candidatus Poribacteria bacterium]|nr:SAVED domain-containing protein [Candidatus Poribacteria bacterium]MDE0466224.1 SAVED domain-containing protein [Candidatus Poribacteria bacterium]
MTKNRKPKPKITRKNVPLHTKLKLFGKSAGRCEFSGCNKLVWRNDLTLTDGNFGEVAHIIAASEDGPRGSEESANLQIEFSNLMLLCQRCHIEIDANYEKYPVELLREWKKKHEERIEIQTRYPEEIHKSTVLLFSVNIGERIVPINPEAYRNAMFPKFPADEKGIRIERDDFDGHSDIEYWQAFAGDIQRKIKWCFDAGVDGKEIKHLSVFAIGPMPLLMFLGKCIGDTVPADLYQSHRNIDDTNHTWSWPKEEQDTETHYIVNPLHVNKDSTSVAIVLSLSGKIDSDRHEPLVSENFSVYEITIENPFPHFLKSRKQLEEFSREYRKLLNEIQSTHGDSCQISIIPAAPAPIAVECGRVLLPKSDPEIFACEYDDQNGLRTVLKINSRL